MALAEPAGVYRPRHPERTVVYRLFEEHFERYLWEYDERYEVREGSLRKVVPAAVEAYLAWKESSCSSPTSTRASWKRSSAAACSSACAAPSGSGRSSSWKPTLSGFVA
jgi:hypothetical protein